METTEGSRPAVSVPPDTQGFRRSVAVLIGIDAYDGDIPRLKSAANDATHLAQLLTEKHHYDEVRLLTNEQASCAALRKLLDGELAELVGDDGQARLLFYFAGHGLAAESDDGRPAGYLVPQDASRDIASMLPMADLLGALDRLTCRHLLLVLDCCFAGAIRWSGTRSLIAPRAKLYRERYLRYLQGRAWQVLTSAAADERASDFVSFGERASATDEGHSPFALALYDGLAGHADLPFDAPYGDGVITARDLAEYLNEQVTLHAIDQQRSQTPQIWEMPRHGKGEYVFLVPGTQSLDLPPTPYSNPYRGLEPFDEAHHEFFFGRSELAETLAEQVQDLPLMVLAGASGVGKSSLLRAGLLPLLRAKAEPSYEILPPVSFGYTPAQPFADLPLPPATPATLSARVGAWAAANPDKKLVLALDDFERLLHWPEQRKRVIDELAGALEAHAERLRVVLTVRAADQAAFGDGPLKQFWSQGRFNVGPIGKDEFRQAILEPAAKCVMFFEPEKQIEWIYDATCNAPGGLALLSLTLRQLYQHAIERNADDREITKDDFDAVGGVRGALLTHASAVYDDLVEAQRSTARRVLLRLVQVDGGTTTQRTISLSELQYPKPAETEQAMRVLRQLADARLVVIGARQNGVGTVELAHQALFSDWDKLNAWVEPERPALDLRRQLIEATAIWQELASKARTRRQRWQASRRLWDDDDPLDQAKAVLVSPRSWLNTAEQQFVQASIDRQNRRQFWQRVTRIAVFSLMAVLTIAALIFAYAAAMSQESADNRAMVAEAQSQLDQGNTGEALALALASIGQSSHEPQMEVVLSEAAGRAARRRFVGHTSGVLSVAFSPDGKTIASGDSGGGLRLWDAASGQALHSLAGHTDEVDALAFSRDGRMLLSGSYDQTVRLWDVATGKELRQFDGEPGYVTGVAFSPDDKTAVSSGYDGELILWNVADGRKITQFEESGEVLYSVAFSPNGKSILAASADHRMHLWDIASETQIRSFTGHTGEVNIAAFSPDGKTIISASDDQTLRLWDVSNGKELGRFEGHDDLVWSAAFSPDGRTVVSSGSDQTVRLWDVATRRELRRFDGHQGDIHSVAFSPDGRMVISGSSDQTVRLWDVAPAQEVREFGPLNQATVQSVAFTPDGTTAATIANDGTLGVWDVSSGHLLRSNPISDDPSSISNLVVSPDGSEAYFYTESGEISEWDLQSATEITRTPGFDSENSSLSQVAISPDGNQILYATSFVSTTTVFYYNWNTQKSREFHGHTADVTSLAFSADGKMALSGSRDRTILEWNIETGQPVKVFRGHARSVTSVAFSPDGKTIISGSDDRTIRLWDAETAQERVRLVGHGGAITSLALSSDGRSLLSGSRDGTLRLWRVETLDELLAWVHANRDVPALPCNVGTNFGLDVSPNCVGIAAPEPTAVQ